MVVEASRLGDSCKLIVSLRRSDVQGDWVREVVWENVDIVVQIGSAAVEEALSRQVSDIRNRTRLTVVPNGVNLDRYALQRRNRGKNLACMGRLTLEANPAFILQCMQKLHYIDPEYRLYFSGAFEDAVLEQYTRHMVHTLGLTGVVSFEPYAGDLNAWLSDKHYIIAGGIGESQVEAVLTAMACGLKPVVHNFPGADRLFPSQYLFNIAEQFCEQVRSDDYAPETYRRFIEENFSATRQLEQVNGILLQLESEIDVQLLAAFDREDKSSQASTGRTNDFAVSSPEGNAHF
jgi:glycosyltransferase involved in cell wall biosynthesis